MSGWEILGTVIGIALVLSMIFYDPLADDSCVKEMDADDDHSMDSHLHKPRLAKTDFPNFHWSCRGLGYYGLGHTMEDAYADWKARAMADAHRMRNIA